MVHDLSHSGITRNETRQALLTAHGGREAHLIMAVGPVVAIILALWLIKPARTETPLSAHKIKCGLVESFHQPTQRRTR
jgi:hypothetical protein